MGGTASEIIKLDVLDFVTIAFIVLKLGKVIDWSWWCVLAPFWIPLAIAAVITFLRAIVAIVDAFS